MLNARFFGVELIRFAGDGYSAFEARLAYGARPVAAAGRSAAASTNEQAFLDQVERDDYRDVLERLFDAVRGLGFTVEWGTVGCSIRIRTPDCAEPLSAA